MLAGKRVILIASTFDPTSYPDHSPLQHAIPIKGLGMGSMLF